MRIAALALLLSLPAAAGAQTPKDIAAQLWPFGAPTSSNLAPRANAAPATGATAADLARLTWGDTLPASQLRAPENAYVSNFNGAAILSLRASPWRLGDAPIVIGAK